VFVDEQKCGKSQERFMYIVENSLSFIILSCFIAPVVSVAQRIPLNNVCI